MPKPREITDIMINAVVFTFLKKALDKFTKDQPEGKKKISKKASIVEGKSQSSAPSNLNKDNVDAVINDPKNFKRLKEKAKVILQRGKVKPTNDTAAAQLLDGYTSDLRELRNFTELDQGVDQIFTDTFLDGLRNRVVIGRSRAGEPAEEQPQPEEDDEPAPAPVPVPYKQISTKKKRKVPKMVEETPPSSDTEDIKAEFKSAIKALKRQIKSVEGKEQAQRLVDEFFEDSEGRGISGYSSYIGLNKIIDKLIQNEYITPSTRLADIGTELLYSAGELTQEEREDKIGQFVYGSNERQEERKDRDKKKKKREKPIPTKRVEQQEPLTVPLMEQLKRNVSAPSMSNGTGLGMTLEELNAIKASKGKPTRKFPKIKPSKATARAKIEEAVSAVLKQEQISTKKNVTTGFEEMGQRLDDINVILASRPELKQIHADVVRQLEGQKLDLKKTDTQFAGLGIDKKIVEELIKTIPESNRAILEPAVRSIAGRGAVNMNNVIAGLVGLSVSLAGSPAMGAVVTPILSGILDRYGVDISYYFLDRYADGVDGEIIDDTDDTDEEEQPQPGKEKEKEKEQKHSKSMTGVLSKQEEQQINEDVYDVISGVVEEAQPRASSDSKRNYIIDSLLSLPETVKRSISARHREHPLETPSEILRNVSVDLELEEQPPQPRYDMPPPADGVRIAQPVAPPPPYPMPPPRPVQPAPVRRTNPFAGSGDAFVQGAGVGAVYGGVSAGISTGSAQGAISGILPGAIAGGIAGLTSEQLLRRYYRRQGIQITPALNRQIRALSVLPTAAVAAYLGYTPSGRAEDVTGSGTISGAGITEKKISVVPEVLEKTQAQLEQEKGKVKVWEPKAIVPSTAILDESQQEKYIDDIEMIAFNYIPPTSEGAQGTVDTNPLKYQQLLESNIRYTNAGVYIPYITWNKINDANNMTTQQLKTKMLGPELPPMKFNTFDNDTTFENVSKWQYVNGENTAIEYQSEYSDFSNVENSWWTNENNVLFTINP
jgi:hypothetical protein